MGVVLQTSLNRRRSAAAAITYAFNPVGRRASMGNLKKKPNKTLIEQKPKSSAFDSLKWGVLFWRSLNFGQNRFAELK
jgi:hypothetical protein